MQVVLRLVLGSALLLCLWRMPPSVVVAARRRLRRSSADGTAPKPFITPLGRDPDVRQVETTAGAFYRDPGAVCEQGGEGGAPPKDLSEYVVVGGDMVNLSEPGLYRVQYTCEAPGGATAPPATRTVLVSAAGCANVRLSSVSFLLDGVYTLSNSVLNGRGVYEQECGGNFLWWMRIGGSEATTPKAPGSRGGGQDRFMRGQHGQWRVSADLNGFHSAHAEGAADTPEDVPAGTWQVQRGREFKADADSKVTCASVPAKGYCFTKFHEHQCHRGVEAAASAVENRKQVQQDAVRGCIQCARRHEATLHSAGCTYLQVVKLCDRFGVLMAPPDKTVAQVLMPSVLSEEHGCDAHGHAAVRQAEEEHILASPLAAARLGPPDGRAVHQSTDCTVTQWGAWSSCSVSCGRGTTVRGRRVLLHSRFGGKACPQLSQQRGCVSEMSGCTHHTRSAITKPPCSAHVRFGEWSKCNADCGAGVQLRMKQTQSCAKFGGASIHRVSRQQRRCNSGPCAGAQPHQVQLHVAPLAGDADDDDDDGHQT